MTVSDGRVGQDGGVVSRLHGSPVQATFVPRPGVFCAICGHGLPAGVDTCTTCLADYGLAMPGVA